MILAKTIKGYGMGEAGEGQNITHQQKKEDGQDSSPETPAKRGGGFDGAVASGSGERKRL